MRRFRALMVAVLMTAAIRSPAPAAAARLPRRGLCATTTKAADGARVAVLSAFPAELAPHVAAATVDTTMEADGRQYYLGRLEGVRVVLGLLGIGTVNAASRTTSVIGNFEPSGIILSGVAGSHYRIADVVVADDFVSDADGTVVAMNPAMLALAQLGAATLPAPFENCTRVPPTSPDGMTVCLPYDPMVIFGGRGHTGDPFGGTAFACFPGGGEVFGCELPPVPAPAARAPFQSHAITTDDVQDMETAAAAGVAAAKNVPFVAVRAVSDGAGDPLGDRGFPAQFFDYYRLAAGNAALVTRSFLRELHALPQAHRGRRICHLLAQHRWGTAAAQLNRPP